MKNMKRIGVTLAALAGVLLATPAAALADTTTLSGEHYGHHVRECAQTMGFTGSHNPGMHQGYAGWNGMSCHD